MVYYHYMCSVYVTRFCGRDIVCIDVIFVCIYMYNVLYTQCTQCKCTYRTFQINMYLMYLWPCVQVLYIVHVYLQCMPYTVNIMAVVYSFFLSFFFVCLCAHRTMI